MSEFDAKSLGSGAESLIYTGREHSIRQHWRTPIQLNRFKARRDNCWILSLCVLYGQNCLCLLFIMFQLNVEIFLALLTWTNCFFFNLMFDCEVALKKWRLLFSVFYRPDGREMGEDGLDNQQRSLSHRKFMWIYVCIVSLQCTCIFLYISALNKKKICVLISDTNLPVGKYSPLPIQILTNLFAWL